MRPTQRMEHVGEPVVVIDSVLLPQASSDLFKSPSGWVDEVVAGNAINTKKLSLNTHNYINA